MPRLIEAVFHHGPDADTTWNWDFLGRPETLRTRPYEAHRLFLASSFAEIQMMKSLAPDGHEDDADPDGVRNESGGIDDAPDQQVWPFPVPRARPEDPMGNLKKAVLGDDFLSSGNAEAAPFGKGAKELEPSVRETHRRAGKADEYAAEAQEAAEDALKWDRGVVNAVNTADQAWDGALYAKHVDEKIDAVVKAMDKLVPPLPEPPSLKCKDADPYRMLRRECQISHGIKQFELRMNDVINRGGNARELGTELQKMTKGIEEAAAPLKIDGELDKGTKELSKILQVNDHPPLFPLENGPGLKDGAVEVPLRFPENPVPMVMEDYTPPDVQARMPPGSSPLDLRSLKGVV